MKAWTNEIIYVQDSFSNELDGWINKDRNGWINKWALSVKINRWINSWMSEQMNELIDGILNA